MRYIASPVGCVVLVVLGAGALAAQERPDELTGCYDITARDLLTDDKVGTGYESEIPRRIEFAGPFPAKLSELLFGDTLRTEIVVPEGALPTAHRLMWGQIIGDSLKVNFSTGFGGVMATLRWAGDRWSGVARHKYDWTLDLADAGPIELAPVGCDSPPPVSIDAMLPIARSVELVGGLVITLGEPLPEGLETVPVIGTIVSVTGALPTGLFGGADSVTVGGAERARVRIIWMHYADPSAYSNAKTRLRRAYGDPRVDESGDARFGNPITRLLMDELGNGTGRISLMDAAYWGYRTNALPSQERPTQLTGCHDITARDLLTDDKVGTGIEDEIPRRIEFAGPFRGWGDRDTLRTEIVVPEGALPSVHTMMSGEIVGDSLHVVFSTGYGGVSAVLGWTGDRWVGSAQTFVDYGPPFEFDAGPIEITPVSCDSPPPVSIDAMLRIARSVELVGGLVITLGEPLPEALGTTPERFAYNKVTGRTTGLFAGTDSIAVGVVERWGVTQIRLHYTDPGAYSNVKARLQRAYGAPEDDRLGDTRFSNPITSLLVDDLGNSQGQIILMDRR